MNVQSTQIALAQIATLVFTSMVLISQPKLAIIICILLMISMAFSAAAAVALSYCYVADQKQIEGLNWGCLTGTHLGGILCYGIVLSNTIPFLP